MAYVLCLIYVAVSYIRPAELNPAFIPYHVAEVTGVLALAGALFSVLLRPRPVLNLPIDWCFLGFIAVAFVADPLGASASTARRDRRGPPAARGLLRAHPGHGGNPAPDEGVHRCALHAGRVSGGQCGRGVLGAVWRRRDHRRANAHRRVRRRIATGSGGDAHRGDGHVRRSERPGDQPADRRAVPLERRAVGRLRRGASNRRTRRPWRARVRVSARAVEGRVPRPGRARWRLRVPPGGAGGDRHRAGGGGRGRVGRRPEPSSEHRFPGSLRPGPHRGLGGGPADGEIPSDTGRGVLRVLEHARARGAQLVRARSCGTRVCRRIPVHRRVLLALRLDEQDEEHVRCRIVNSRQRSVRQRRRDRDGRGVSLAAVHSDSLRAGGAWRRQGGHRATTRRAGTGVARVGLGLSSDCCRPRPSWRRGWPSECSGRGLDDRPGPTGLRPSARRRPESPPGNGTGRRPPPSS